MSSSRLLVPMYMEALVLRNAKNDCLDIGPALPGDGEAKILGDAMKPEMKLRTLEAGVHLHWTLPAALKHAFVDDGREIAFPFVPNRWLVIRVQTNKGISSMPSRTWLLESDTRSDDQSRSNIVLVKSINENAANKQQFEFIKVGRSTELLADSAGRISGYSPVNPPAPILKAVFPANPGFASFYPGCRNVFGFHDPMDDLPGDATVTYIVSGWYSDATADPLHPLGFQGEPATQQQKKKKRSLDWFRRQWKYAGNAADYPNASLLHASVYAVQWNDQSRVAIPAGDVQVYTGNTSMEALSVKLAKRFSVSNDHIEDLFNALQFELLEDELNTPGLASLTNQIHKRGFSQKDGGSIWEIARKETNDQQLQEQDEKRLPFPKDPDLLIKLKRLNKLQAEVNKLLREIAGLQQEYYFLWYKKAYQVSNKLTVTNFDYDGSRIKIAADINNRKTAAGVLAGQADAIKNEIAAHQSLQGDAAEYELKPMLEDRFWEPNEPVLLLGGEKGLAGNADRPDFEKGDGTINCRKSGQQIHELALGVPTDAGIISLLIGTDRFAAPYVDILKKLDALFVDITGLVYETLLLDQALSSDIALLAYNEAQIGAGKTTDSPVIKQFAETQVRQAQVGALSAGAQQPGSASPPAYAIRKWIQAWSPLYMVWEADYAPVNRKDPGDLEDATAWKTDDGLLFKNQSADSNNWSSTSIKGITPFSTAAIDNLQKILPGELVRGLQYDRSNLLAQALSGFHKALLMQKADIQLPPFAYKPDPVYVVSTEYKIDQQELDSIGNSAYQLGSDPGRADGTGPDRFYPLRSGLMRVVSLSLVDAFGQEKKIIIKNSPGKIDYPAAIKGIATAAENIVPLSPRILQPSRLIAQWLNAAGDVIYQDAGAMDSPVFGWLVPNKLDRSIMMYDVDGSEVAILQVTSDINQPKGLGLETIPFPSANRIPDLAANPHLKSFLEGITNGSIVSGLLDLATKTSLNIAGSNAMRISTASLICGQPIALARCAVSLELMGLPTRDQRWDASGKEDYGKIEALKIPLSFGDFNKEKDGLLGFFTNADYDAFYQAANVPDIDMAADEPYFRPNAAISISLDRPPTPVTLMLDPSAGVHISSGVLPTKYLELFHHSSKAMLASLDISFMVAPFIAEKVSPGIPVPAGINANWKWVHKTDVGTFTQEEEIAEGKNKQRSSFKKLQVYEGWLKLSNLKDR